VIRVLRRLARDTGGYSLIELLVTMSIFGTVIGGLTTIFVQGSNAQLDLNRRFQAQTNVALALNRLRRDAHCASAITPTGASASISMTLPSQCFGGGGTINWCTIGSGSHYGLYRIANATCSTSGVRVADYLTASTVFTYTGQITGTSLAKLHVDLPVNINPSKPTDTYELTDDLVLRNSTRA
jgi:prepilin-type N-terminal cleavage/methylation domain-containing protein